MKSLVITEKPSQAANVKKAVGNLYGDVLPAQGHLLRLQMPHEVREDWKSWTTTLLKPVSGRYGLVEDHSNGKGERLSLIKNALSNADQVIIATDCDREGQAIGENLLRFYKFKGRVLRAIFTAEDELSLQQAFQQAKPNSEFLAMYEAASARAQSDQIFNLSLTRTATVALIPKGAHRTIGIGRVRTPTMGIVCRREQELTNFKSKLYYELIAYGQEQSVEFELAHKPAGEERLFQRKRAQSIQSSMSGWSGPVSVRTNRKAQSPPRPVDLATLQKRAAAWGWSAKKTLEITQALYETHKITTYPRAATRYLPENMIDSAKGVFKSLSAIESMPSIGWSEATIRTGKKGVFSTADSEGESHHAIIPNPSVADQLAVKLAKLDDDERQLFDLIANSFMAALGPDHIYNRTEIAVEGACGGDTVVFSAAGRQILEQGWRALYSDERDTNESDELAELPALKNGQTITLAQVDIVTKQTAPPPRYSEGSLIEAMQNSWRFVIDEGERERLKEAKGIGTPATRDTIIEGLKRQNLISVIAKGRLQASTEAMELYALLSTHCPELLDPGATARMETRLDNVMNGRVDADTVIDEISDITARNIELLAGQDKQLSVKRTPSPAMVEAAKTKAKREGKRLAKSMAEDYEALRAFLGPIPKRTGPAGSPSEAQLSLARGIAERSNLAIPTAILENTRALSQWIDANNMATDKQHKLIARLVKDRSIKAPTGYPGAVPYSVAKAVLDKALGKPKSKRP